MNQMLKRRCCNSFALALALVWSLMVVYTAIDYVQSVGTDAPETAHTVASINSFYP